MRGRLAPSVRAAENPVNVLRSSNDEGGESSSKTRIALGALILLAVAGLYWGLLETGALSAITTDEQAIRAWIDQLGAWGPLVIVALIMVAVVASPIPSGPIALAAGAAFGPVWGTVYVVLGAEAGALVAFWVARGLGYDVVRRWARVRPLLRRLERQRSQTWLMAIVFASRLVPFISFDAVSYAAGLTPLASWRFAIATATGVIPVAFLLTYFGEALIAMGPTPAVTLLILGGITAIPVLARLLWSWYRREK